MHELRAIRFKNELIENGIVPEWKLKKVYLHQISADEYLQDLNLSSKFNTSGIF